jgi:AcrR family transcriptional regulator
MGRARTATKQRRSDGERSHAAILAEAARLASVTGLEGLSIGGLARETGMSKSGLYAHFGSKRGLQLATVEEAAELFKRVVVSPALERPRGVERLRAACELFLDHVEERVFPGGCFFASAAADSQPGPARDRLAEFQAEWLGFLTGLAREARRTGELGADLDPDQVAFELNAMLLAANSAFCLHGDESAFARAREGIAGRLRLPSRPGPRFGGRRRP